MDLENEQQSAADNAETLLETEAKATEGESSAPETEETDEEKNKRVQVEAEQKAIQKEERRKASVQKRMDELTADKYAERKRADQLAEQNAKILALLEERQAPKTQTNGEPTREQYESYEDFITARAEYRAELKVQKALEQFTQKQTETQQKTTQEQEIQALEKQFLERKTAVEKSVPDFKDVIEDWEPKLPSSVVDMILRMPDGPLISYHLAKNPELEAQFNSQPSYMQGIILGQISASLKTTPKVSSAPAPGKPVASKPGSSTEPPSDPQQYWEWAKKHMK
jgi:hypothetical protein